MTIIEALKSGKNFKRKVWVYWASSEHHTTFNHADVLADDWEIEPESKPKLKAYISNGVLRFSSEDWQIPPSATRAPWLDEP